MKRLELFIDPFRRVIFIGTTIFDRQKSTIIAGPIGFLTVFMALTASQAQAQISYTTSGSNYTQNFDNLFGSVPGNNTTQAASVLPLGWVFAESGANANTTLRVDNGSSGTGDTYLFGATASNERAFGGYASGSLTSIFGAQLTNNTGSTLTQFTLTFDGEQWKDGGSGSAVINTDAFSYGLGNASIGAGAFTNFSGLNFSALVNNTTADVATDGNNGSFRTAGISATVTGLNWTNGQSLWIRWSDPNDTGNDDGLAVDNVVFSALNGALPATVTWATGAGTWDAAAGNWTGGIPTANLYKDGDTATFDNSATGGAVTIQTGGVSPGSTIVNNDPSHPYTLQNTGGDTNGIKTGSLTKSGSGVLTLASPNTFSGGMNINGGIVSISNDNQLGAASGTVSFDGGTLKTTANVSSARTLTVTVNGATIDTNGGDLTLTASNSITGSGSVTKTGNNVLVLRNAGNAFAGTFNVNQGILRGDGVALGGVAAGTFGDAATVNIANGATYDESYGDGEGLGAITGQGTVIGRNGFDLRFATTANFTFDGKITAGDNGTLGVLATDRVMNVAKLDVGVATLTNATSDFAGQVQIDRGTISVAAVANKGNASSLGVGNFNVTPAADIRLGSSTNRVGTLQFTGTSGSTNRSIEVAGGGGAIDVATGSSLVLAGAIAGVDKAITKTGDGTLYFNGTMELNTVDWVVSAGLFGGSGTIGDDLTIAGGTYSAGNSPGIQTVSDDFGLEAGATFLAELRGLTAGVGGYDQLTVLSDVNLNGGSLSVDLGSFLLSSGEIFKIIDVGGVLTGIFSGLANNALVGNFGGTNLFVRYNGGDGNDVELYTLTATPEPSSLMLGAMGLIGLVGAYRRRRVA